MDFDSIEQGTLMTSEERLIGPDPLQIPLVLEKIFSHLQGSGQKSFRLTCRFWRDSSLDSWRKSCVVLMINHFILNRFLQNREKTGTLRFAKLFEESSEPFVRLNEKPFRNFSIAEEGLILPPYDESFAKVVVWDYDLIPNKARETNYLFNVFGPSMESLKMEFCPWFRHNKILQGFKWILLEKCVNLQKLSVNPRVLPELDDSPQEDELDENGEEKVEEYLKKTAESLVYLNIQSNIELEQYITPGFCRELLKIVPNLKTLVLDMGSAQILQALKYPLEDSKFIQLNSLNVTVTDTHFSDLSEYMAVAKPNLQTLKLVELDINNVRSPPFHFHRFLSDCTKTLTQLSLHFSWKWTNYSNSTSFFISELSGHNFPNLTQLFIKSELWHQSVDDVKPIRFDFQSFRGMPKLQKFHCVADQFPQMGNHSISPEQLYFEGKLDWDDRTEEDKLQTSVLLNNMQEFCLFLNEKLDEDCLKTAAKWMPRLTRLALIVYDETFPLCFQLWPNLDKFTVLSNSSIEEAQIRKVEATRVIKIDKIEDEKQCFDKFAQVQ